MKHNNQANQLSFPEKLLTVLLLVGIFLTVGSVIGVCILSEINHDWIAASIAFVIPLVIVGLVIVFISIKLLEWMA